MGILANFSVYGLMVVPLIIMARGHSIQLPKMALLAAVMATVQFGESIIMSSINPGKDTAAFSAVVSATLTSIIECLLFHFVLNDNKAMRVFRVVDSSSDGDAAAAVATLWCTVHTVFFRWFPWYHSMSSLGYEVNHIIGGVSAFWHLVTVLCACRRLQGRPLASVGVVLVAIQLVSTALGQVVAPDMPLVGETIACALTIATTLVFPAVPEEEKVKTG